MTVPSQSTVRALNTNNNKPSFYPNDNKIDQFIRKLKFEPMEYSTDQFEYHRASSLPTVTFFGQGGTVNNNVTAVSTETDTFVRLGQTCAIDLLDNLSSYNDQQAHFSQLEQQVRGAKLSILRELSTAIITGSGPSEVVGLSDQVNLEGNGTYINNASFPLTLETLYRMANTTRGTDNFVGSYSGRYFISNERSLRLVMQILDNTGRTVEFQYDEDLQTEIPVLFGLPWLVTDSISYGGAAANTTFYVAQLEGETAIKMLYAKDPNQDCDEWGIHCFDVPLQQTTSQISKGVFGFYALNVPEASLTMMGNVQTSGVAALP